MTSLVLFTRSLRVQDHPALRAGASAGDVVPTFIVDAAIRRVGFAGPNRARFLAESLGDLDASLRQRGGRLVVREGDWVQEALRVAHETGAQAIHVTDDVSRLAQHRLTALEAAARRARIAVHAHPGVTVVPPGAITPVDRDHYRVFTPYYRAWLAQPWRPVVLAPRRVDVPDRARGSALPKPTAFAVGSASPQVPTGGESAARRAWRRWARASLPEYSSGRDQLADDRTSHLGAALHFGCISPLELAVRARELSGATEFVRQLCWRDFFHQLLAARPDAAWSDYKPARMRWSRRPRAFEAWTDGRTGYPIVDASMRQLQADGYMPNRARMIVASFLTKDLKLDWRVGARHFLAWLVDGDLANNNLNWQWVAGTGTDTNSNRVLSPIAQAQRFDRDGAYVRRYVPELADLPGRAVHLPDDRARAQRGYPKPIIDQSRLASRT